MQSKAASLGPIAGVFLVATTMIGSGVFLLPATVAAIGTISLLGWLVASLGALLVGAVLALLARRVPGEGFLETVEARLGPDIGQSASILYCLSVMLSCTGVALAAAGYLTFVFPALGELGGNWVAIGLIWLFVGLNMLGADHVARWGGVTLIAGLVPILLVATYGWTQFDADLFAANWNQSGLSATSAVVQATQLLFWAFLGLETASVVAVQVRNPKRNIPIATVGGILLAALVYIASTTAISGMFPAAELARSSAPFADATVPMLGKIAALVVAVAAAAKTTGTLGSLKLGTAESFLSIQKLMGIKGLSRNAILVMIGVVASVAVELTSSPTLGEQYGQIIAAVVTLTFPIFAAACWVLVLDSRGLARLLGVMGGLFSVFMLVSQPLNIQLIALGSLLAVYLLVLALRRFAKS